MPSSHQKRILVCPLDWGLGHATRCVPLIREFQAQGAEVLVATTGLQVAFFEQECPELKQIRAISYQIRYPKHGWLMPFWLLQELPRLRKLIREEQHWADLVCKDHNIDLIVSDNRFGCYSRSVPSIYITHQVRIPFQTPFQPLEFLGQSLHAYFQKSFQEVWIPDTPDYPGLGGRMSHYGLKANKHRHIGSLTRFQPLKTPIQKQFRWLAMLSGPEPQRSLLESKILDAFLTMPGPKVLVQGKPGCSPLTHNVPELQVFSHLKSDELRATILASEVILCRSGYSSLMDLQTLQAKAVLIPTPGQTEQESLAKSLHDSGICGFVPQGRISASTINQAAGQAQGFTLPSSHSTLLQQAVHSALQRLP